MNWKSVDLDSSHCTSLKAVLGWLWETVFNSVYYALVQIRKGHRLGGLPHKLTVNGTKGKYMGLFIMLEKGSPSPKWL